MVWGQLAALMGHDRWQQQQPAGQAGHQGQKKLAPFDDELISLITISLTLEQDSSSDGCRHKRAVLHCCARKRPLHCSSGLPVSSLLHPKIRDSSLVARQSYSTLFLFRKQKQKKTVVARSVSYKVYELQKPETLEPHLAFLLCTSRMQLALLSPSTG